MTAMMAIFCLRESFSFKTTMPKVTLTIGVAEMTMEAIETGEYFRAKLKAEKPTPSNIARRTM